MEAGQLFEIVAGDLIGMRAGQLLEIEGWTVD